MDSLRPDWNPVFVGYSVSTEVLVDQHAIVDTFAVWPYSICYRDAFPYSNGYWLAERNAHAHWELLSDVNAHALLDRLVLCHAKSLSDDERHRDS